MERGRTSEASARERTMARKPPWKPPNPYARSGRARKLTASQKFAARKRARKAGRRYPNLVDNMWAAQRSRPQPKRQHSD